MATGRVYKRGKSWYLDIRTGRIIDGKPERIRKAARGFGKKDASEHLAELLYNMNRSAITGGAYDNSCLLSSIRELWFKELDLQIKREKTRHDYKNHFDRIYEWLDKVGIYAVESITPEVISLFKEYALSLNLSHRTINLSLQKLKAAIELAKDQGAVVTNPLAKIRQLPEKRVKFRRDLRKDEVQALLRCAGDEYKLIWFFMVSTGVRLDEMASLLWVNVDLDKSTVYIRGNEENTVKTMTSNRAIPLSPELVALLREHKSKSVGKYVFGLENGLRKRENNILKAFKRHMFNAFCDMRVYPYGQGLRLTDEQKAEFTPKYEEINKELEELDIHSLRYTFITELISQGVDPKTVQTLAGHKDIQTTLNIYAQCRQGNIENAISVLPWQYSQSS